MKFQLMSDLHLEFGWDYPDVEEKLDTTLILAGDIETNLFALENFVTYMCSKYERVIMVAGNHEFYGQDYRYVLSELRKIGPNNFIFMENNSLTLMEEKVQIIGATLWSSPSFGVFNYINDSRLIQYDNRKLCSSDIEKFNEYSTKYIKSKLEKDLGLGWRKVVVTHFGPDARLMHPKWLKDNQMSTYFWASGFENHFHMATAWFFGHTHDPTNMLIDGCRCVCNPHGYVWMNGKQREHYNFDFNKIIEV